MQRGGEYNGKAEKKDRKNFLKSTHSHNLSWGPGPRREKKAVWVGSAHNTVSGVGGGAL